MAGLAQQHDRTRVQRFVRLMGLQAIHPRRRTSQHQIYSCLLRGLNIDRPNQVWTTDITYIPTAQGFMYLAAITDWHSRRVLSWPLSIMEPGFRVETLEEALSQYWSPGGPKTDQGDQFTAAAFTDALKAPQIQINTDDKGRRMGNVLSGSCGGG